MSQVAGSKKDYTVSTLDILLIVGLGAVGLFFLAMYGFGWFPWWDQKIALYVFLVLIWPIIYYVKLRINTLLRYMKSDKEHNRDKE